MFRFALRNVLALLSGGLSDDPLELGTAGLNTEMPGLAAIFRTAGFRSCLVATVGAIDWPCSSELKGPVSRKYNPARATSAIITKTIPSFGSSRTE